MILNLIIGLGAALGLFLSFRSMKLIPAIITIGMATGVALVMLPNNITLTTGLTVYIIFVVFALAYGILARGLTIWSRIVICIMSASIILFWFWRLNHLHGNEILLPVISLLTGAAALLSKAKLRNEAGFLVILGADAVAIIVEHLMKAS